MKNARLQNKNKNQYRNNDKSYIYDFSQYSIKNNKNTFILIILIQIEQTNHQVQKIFQNQPILNQTALYYHYLYHNFLYHNLPKPTPHNQ